MTSPPYWGLRDYGVKGQIGLEFHPQEYVENLVKLFSEARRVLKPSGSLFLNLGDTYCSTKGYCRNAGGSVTSISQPAFKVLNGTRNPNRMLRPDGKWLQPKQLLMIPARVAIALQDDGWVLRNDIIWNKPNGMPTSVKDRLANRYEHVFHFVKSKRYFFDLDAIRVPHRSLHPQGRSRRAIEGRTPHTNRHLFGLRKAGTGYVGHAAGKNPGDVIKAAGGKRSDTPYRYNNLHLSWLLYGRDEVHPAGKNPGDIVVCSPETRRLGEIIDSKQAVKVPSGKGWIGHPPGGMARILRENDQRWLSPGGKNPGDFWTISTRPFKGAHFAVYPEKLCEMPIKAACPESVCKRCGIPRERITQRWGWQGSVWNDRQPNRTPAGRRGPTRLWAEKPVYRTKGWTRCGCKAGFRSGIVFDPFAGAGTTLVVAKRLGRRYLGCDLNRDYVKLARRRLRSAVQLVSK